MRIGFDAKRAFLNNSGLGNYSRNTINLVTHYFPKKFYFLFTPKITKSGMFIKNENHKICLPDRLIDKYFSSYWRSKTIIKDLQKEKIDIYHGLSNEIPIGIEKTDIKTVVTIHDLIFLRHPEFFRRIDREIYYRKFKSSCERANKIIAVSENTKKDIIHFFKISNEKIKVIYQSCNDFFKHELKNEYKNNIKLKYKLPENYLLYVGNIEKRKNLKQLLKAITGLCMNLVIVGEGKKYKNECLNFIFQNKLEKYVYFVSTSDPKELSSIYQNAQILIYPSLYEGFGIPIIEALFSKTPVITSKGSCFKEAGGPASIYIDPNSASEIKNAINKILTSKKFRNNIINNGIEYAQKFNDRYIGEQIFEIYKEL